MYCVNLFRFLRYSASFQRGDLRRLSAAAWLGTLCIGLAACEPPNVKNVLQTTQARPADPVAAQEPKADVSPATETSANPSLASLPPASKVTLTPPDGVRDQVPIGLLLPLSGRHAGLGKSLLRAAQLAMFEVADENFVLLPQDTKGTPEGAVEAAQRAIEMGAQLLVGPVFGRSARAVAPLALKAAVNLIAFTNDRAAAAKGTFVFGFLPEDRVRRVVSYAVSQGIQRFAALIPDGSFGDRIAADYARAVGEAGGILVRTQRYSRGASSATEAVKQLGNYRQRRVALLAERGRLAQQDNAESRRALKRLEKNETLGDVPFDAVLLLETGQALRATAPLLPYYEIDTRKVRILGIDDWSSRSLRREPTLAGAWYAGPSPAAHADFAKRFTAVYKAPPHALAALAYDVTALAAVKGGKGAGGFGLDQLTVESGFAGSVGLFRLRQDGLVEHRFAVIEVQPDGVKVVSPAPESFEVVQKQAPAVPVAPSDPKTDVDIKQLGQ
jgi:branched-chain amino acid transport system substrate-binding protein